MLITANLVDLKIPQIWAKAIQPVARQDPAAHRRQPRHLPRAEAGERIAHLVSGRMLDFIEFDDDFAIVKMYPPKPIRGMTLTESDVRSKYGVTVVGVKSPGKPFTYATERRSSPTTTSSSSRGTEGDIERFAALE